MKRFLNSIQAKLFLIVASIVVITILFLVIINGVIFEAYYYYHIKNHHSEVLSETLGEDGWKFLDCYRIVNGEKMYEPIIAAFDENGMEHYFTYTKVYDRDPKTQTELVHINIYMYQRHWKKCVKN